MPKVWDSSTVMTPSLPTLSMASEIISPISVSAAEIEATWAIWPLDSVSRAMPRSDATAASTPASMPFFSDIGLAPAATLRRPSWTMAQASTVAVVVPSPATSSVFLATSLTSSAPIRSKGSSSSMSLAMDTPSLVMVGAPHFLSRTTLRPFGPRVTRTASASLFMPLSRDRRASSSNVMSFAIRSSSVIVSTRRCRVLIANHEVMAGATAPPHPDASALVRKPSTSEVVRWSGPRPARSKPARRASTSSSVRCTRSRASPIQPSTTGLVTSGWNWTPVWGPATKAWRETSVRATGCARGTGERVLVPVQPGPGRYERRVDRVEQAPADLGPRGHGHGPAQHLGE